MSNDANKKPETPAEIEADIERQREDLAETVDALQHKLDVKAQATDKIDELKDKVRSKKDELSSDAQQQTTQLKGQARAGAGQVADLATTDAGSPRPELVVASVSLVALGVGIILVQRGR